MSGHGSQDADYLSQEGIAAPQRKQMPARPLAGPDASLEQVMDAVADMHVAGVPCTSNDQQEKSK